MQYKQRTGTENTTHKSKAISRPHAIICQLRHVSIVELFSLGVKVCGRGLFVINQPKKRRKINASGLPTIEIIHVNVDGVHAVRNVPGMHAGGAGTMAQSMSRTKVAAKMYTRKPLTIPAYLSVRVIDALRINIQRLSREFLSTK